jgi:hypothetical protein
LPQELRLAGITGREAANESLRDRYIAVFNEKFKVPATEKGTAFRRTARTDLDWVFTLQTERVVSQDNTVAIMDRTWQPEKSRFRSSLAGCTVTIHDHLNGTISIRYGPHVVGATLPMGTSRRRAQNRRWKSRARGTVENHKPVFPPGSHRPEDFRVRNNAEHSHDFHIRNNRLLRELDRPQDCGLEHHCRFGITAGGARNPQVMTGYRFQFSTVYFWKCRFRSGIGLHCATDRSSLLSGKWLEAGGGTFVGAVSISRTVVLTVVRIWRSVNNASRSTATAWRRESRSPLGR